MYKVHRHGRLLSKDVVYLQKTTTNQDTTRLSGREIDSFISRAGVPVLPTLPL